MEHQILAVIVAEGNVIRNKLIPICEDLDTETILKLNILLNTMLNGKTIAEINLQMISSMKEQAGIHSNIISEWWMRWRKPFTPMKGWRSIPAALPIFPLSGTE